VQKHEAEIRNHIRTEQQLRLFIENLETEDHIKDAQIENLNEKLRVMKKENEELNEALDGHKRELSMVRNKKFKKPDREKIGKGSLPHVKKTLTNSQGSIVKTV
jgi:predicted nuclease with TOPRIM domain